MTDGPVIIVGAGHAGFHVAAYLRQFGFKGRICLINDERHPPYQRPPLSKAYINGSISPDSLLFRPASFYHEENIDVIQSRVVAIDRQRLKLLLASGNSLDYGHVVLATGARNRLVDLPNANLPDVRYLRILDESEALRSILTSRKRVVIIGAGFIGLEFASVARVKGLEVDVIELAPRVMARAVTAEVSDYFQARHREAGIRIHLGVHATSIEADGGKVASVSLSDGRHLKADLVVVGIGVLPNIELAAEAGLPVASGVVVDEYLLTADPNISAIGDCALFTSSRFGGSLRLESVQNAMYQARCVAARLVGDKRPYDGQPWFWSDQGDSKLQIAGLTTGYDQVVLRGASARKAFSVFCYKAGKLVAVESVNRASDHIFGRRMLVMGRSLAPERAADENFNLKSELA
ncbi:pyridine nucleotide-disulfide oxidoreductase [Bradyrhizobium yuanmingense]|uniref:Pyridine nucleotide-disulfide oxidoreductase n=1 Tax=Bradyrhizobium yuanmingense TaxID=108015 RepID=A0A0R3CLY5_9BRAD|nr:FAD-dependent oxidoreductase [Bradyrhizobium yuanmingense]KRP98736.1 pyridine nucleotide-disulfide oxidoreductase [Bradyrhizobium yuanmingense]